MIAIFCFKRMQLYCNVYNIFRYLKVIYKKCTVLKYTSMQKKSIYYLLLNFDTTFYRFIVDSRFIPSTKYYKIFEY